MYYIITALHVYRCENPNWNILCLPRKKYCKLLILIIFPGEMHFIVVILNKLVQLLFA